MSRRLLLLLFLGPFWPVSAQAPKPKKPEPPPPPPKLVLRKTKHYRVLTDLTDKQQLTQLDAFLDGCHATYADLIGKKPVRKLATPLVRVYLHKADYERYGKQDKTLRFNKNWRGYYARARNELISYLGKTPLTELFSILSHEGFHQFAWRYVVRPGTDRLPDWFEEGLADYFRSPRLGADGKLERVPKKKHMRRLKAAIQDGTVWTWEKLWKTNPANLGRKDEFELFYAQAYGLMRFLMEKGGKARIQKVYRLKRQGVFNEEALLRVFPSEQRNGLHRAFLRYAYKLDAVPKK